MRCRELVVVLTVSVCAAFAGCKKQAASDTKIVWGGTVSHHGLADEYIDRFFCKIKKKRSVKTFFIICPSHFGLSTYDYSLDDFTWKCENGNKVFSDTNKVLQIADKLGVGLDKHVFYPEHGVSTLVPYISKYFPNAKIVAIAVKGEPPVDVDYAQRLYDVLCPYFEGRARKENFLVISTDFSHHDNLKETLRKDSSSKKYFETPDLKNWFLCGCDNRPGIYVLSKFANDDTKVVHLEYTNAYEICGESEDITSYFFSLLED